MRKKVKTFFTVPFKIGVLDRNPDISDEEAVKVVLKSVFGENFFYSYYAEDDKIFYAGFPASTVLVGKTLPVFYPALLQEGCYYYKVGKNYFLFFRDKEQFYSKTATVVPRDCKNVFEVKVDKIPKSVYLKWSLEKRSISILILSLVFFLFSVGFYFVRTGKQKVIRPRVDIKVVFLKKPQCKLSKVLEKIALKAINLNGGIEKIEYRHNILTSILVFPDKDKAKLFASDMGGELQGNKVIYTAKIICKEGEGK